MFVVPGSVFRFTVSEVGGLGLSFEGFRVWGLGVRV